MLISLDVASLGTYVLSAYKDGRICVYSVKGKLLHSTDVGVRLLYGYSNVTSLILYTVEPR